MKKHNMMRVASALAVVTLLSTSVISGTLAKYTSTANGESAVATVAKWSFNVGAGEGSTNQAVSATTDITNTNNFTFNLFNSTIRDTVDGQKEGDVVVGAIAPGTWGYVDLVLENSSDVTTSYEINLKPENDSVPLKYKTEKLTNVNATKDVATTVPSGTWYDSETDLKISKDDNDSATLSKDGSVAYRVYWKWDTESDDADTELGKKAGQESGKPQPKITATVIANQVD